MLLLKSSLSLALILILLKPFASCLDSCIFFTTSPTTLSLNNLATASKFFLAYCLILEVRNIAISLHSMTDLKKTVMSVLPVNFIAILA